MQRAIQSNWEENLNASHLVEQKNKSIFANERILEFQQAKQFSHEIKEISLNVIKDHFTDIEAFDKGQPPALRVINIIK